MQFRAAGFEPAEREVLVEEGRTAEVEIVLSRGASVAGRVVDAAGKPVAGAGVSVSSHTEDEGGSHDHGVDTTTDAHASGARIEGLELVLVDRRALSGRIVVPDGTGYANAEVLLLDVTRDKEHRLQTDTAGAFCAVGLGDGPVRAWAWIADADGALRAIGSLERARGDDADLRIPVLAPGTVSLTLDGWSSRLPPRVELRDVQGRRAGVPPHRFNGEWRPRMRISGSGSFVTLTDLEPGAWWLTAIGVEDRALAGHVRVEVRTGTATAAELELEPATDLEVALFQDGQRIEGSVHVREADGFVQLVEPEPVDLARSDPSVPLQLPPGHDTITGTHEGRSASAEVTLRGQALELLRLNLE